MALQNDVHGLIVVGTAFHIHSRKRPNYGKAVGMKASEWWANVSTYTSCTISGRISFNFSIPHWTRHLSRRTVVTELQETRSPCLLVETILASKSLVVLERVFFDVGEPEKNLPPTQSHIPFPSVPLPLPPSKISGVDAVGRSALDDSFEAVLPFQLGAHFAYRQPDGNRSSALLFNHSFQALRPCLPVWCQIFWKDSLPLMAIASIQMFFPSFEASVTQQRTSTNTSKALLLAF